MSKKENGVSATTPKNMVFGAGTIHKGLKYATNSWNFDESLVGATSGGSKLTIKPEIKDIEVDNVVTKVKGLAKKIGSTATIEINFAQLSADLIKSAVIGTKATSTDTNYDLIEDKADIEEGDYWENVAFVGETLDGEHVIVILDNALCTSGLELEGKNKENSVFKGTFECYADMDDVESNKLPYHIYYPKVTN